LPDGVNSVTLPLPPPTIAPPSGSLFGFPRTATDLRQVHEGLDDRRAMSCLVELQHERSENGSTFGIAPLSEHRKIIAASLPHPGVVLETELHRGRRLKSLRLPPSLR
jgi:hypothetical protein